MYDISTDDDNVKNYTKFRNNLLSLGYCMMQYSIYVKCIGSSSMFVNEKNKLKRIIPNISNIRVLLITEKQYQEIEFLSGEKSMNEYYNGEEKYIKL
ncbi:CRISPR-associated endonuclease Cas2 [Mycoplasma sp. NEAQ87857]|nr:CRISPR-associated endonuclease Cas2 [Mycoplasma sp. NEAQ87857]